MHQLYLLCATLASVYALEAMGVLSSLMMDDAIKVHQSQSCTPVHARAVHKHKGGRYTIGPALTTDSTQH